MPTHKDLASLRRFALSCEGATNKDASTVLWKMAEHYQSEAVKLDSDKSPDTGEPPARFEGVPLALAQ
jgi:hypothetical protein